MSVCVCVVLTNWSHLCVVYCRRLMYQSTEVWTCGVISALVSTALVSSSMYSTPEVRERVVAYQCCSFFHVHIFFRYYFKHFCTWGTWWVSLPRFVAGPLFSTFGILTQLTELDLCNNELSGECSCSGSCSSRVFRCRPNVCRFGREVDEIVLLDTAR